MFEQLESLDQQLLLYINGQHNALLDQLMWYAESRSSFLKKFLSATGHARITIWPNTFIWSKTSVVVSMALSLHMLPTILDSLLSPLW